MISKQLQIFICTRLIFALAILLIIPFYDSRTFTWVDLNLYSGEFGKEKLFWELPNPLFSALARLINYTPSLIKSWYFIILSLFVNISVSSFFIYISTNIHSRRASYFYSILLGAHPYLALYSLKLDTSLFAVIPMGLICTGVLLRKWRHWTLLATAFFSLFRNALLPMGWILALKEYRKLKLPLHSIGLIFLSLSSLLQFNYAIYYIGQNFGCYSRSNISSWLNNQDFGLRLSETLSYFFTPLIHLALDLGARESIATYCLILPAEFASILWIHVVSTICFFIFHGWLFWRLFKYIYYQYKVDKHSIELIYPLAVLLPTLYGAAHMRYLIPLLPMLLLFIFQIRSPKKAVGSIS